MISTTCWIGWMPGRSRAAAGAAGSPTTGDREDGGEDDGADCSRPTASLALLTPPGDEKEGRFDSPLSAAV